MLRYNPDRGCAFRTFMYRTIRFAILDANDARKALKRSEIPFADIRTKNGGILIKRERLRVRKEYIGDDEYITAEG